nr:ferredoxin [Micromonospora okii]
MARVEVARERCCGSGNCVLTAPDVFDQDDADGLVLLRRPEPPPEAAERVRRAVDLCPAGAIRLAPAGDGQPSRAGSVAPETASTS